MGGKVGYRREKQRDFSLYVVANDTSIQVEFLLSFFFFNTKKLKDMCEGLQIYQFLYIYIYIKD